VEDTLKNKLSQDITAVRKGQLSGRMWERPEEELLSLYQILRFSLIKKCFRSLTIIDIVEISSP
jgi:hypothetical protein